MALGASSLLVTEAVSAQQDIDITSGPGSSRGDNTPENLFGDDGAFQTITNVLLFLIGAVSVIMLIIGGIRYTTSNGDATAVQSAKNTILYSIVGIVVAILAYAVVRFVVGAFTS
jgi:multisubunit Na+/H+ antiporter MnhB subunit